uniref:Dynein heavy chain, cytoplasmic n=1 Tax=Ditylenchus dipsaci TaxID=166011 RepID=A0A915D2S6_9BILA
MNAFTTSAATLLSRYSENLLKEQCQEALSQKIRGDESVSAALVNSAIRLIDSFNHQGMRLLVCGLHRVNGSIISQHKAMEILQHALGSELKTLMIRDLSAEDKAGCLRMVLRKLPDTLFPSCQRDALIDLADIANNNDKSDENVLKALQILVYFMPETFKLCLKKLLSHLNAIVLESATNKMGIENIAIMFASTIFPIMETNDSLAEVKGDITRLCKLFPILLNHSDELFCLPDELVETFLETSKLETSNLRENTFDGFSSPMMEEEPEVVLSETCNRRSTPSRHTTELETAKLMADISTMPEGPKKNQLVRRVKKSQRQQLGLPRKNSILKKVFNRIPKNEFFTMKEILLITSNVGSVFGGEKPAIRKNWISHLVKVIENENAKLVAINLQETGGKNFKQHSKDVPGLVEELHSKISHNYKFCRCFLDIDFDRVEEYTALSSIFFIHNSAISQISQYNFANDQFMSVDSTSTPLLIKTDLFAGGCPMVRKEKFSREFWPSIRWGRKGYLWTRWSINKRVVDLVNIHLFHDENNLAFLENPSQYADNRAKALNHTLKQLNKLNTTKINLFIFGDFNFRLDIRSFIKKLTTKTTEKELENPEDSSEECNGQKESSSSENEFKNSSTSYDDMLDEPMRRKNSVIEYRTSFEYSGIQEKLVKTPLTDRCYFTMTQALHCRLGGLLFGPAGTGKTESVKALGHHLGRFVLVFNCDETFDFQAIGRILVWFCQERMLSAVSQQIQTIQESVKADEEMKVDLVGKRLSVNSNMAIFIAMNPAIPIRYSGRSNLPDNLKQLFRSLAMTQPDRKLIAEVMLFSQGFQTAETLAKKIVPLFTYAFCRAALRSIPLRLRCQIFAFVYEDLKTPLVSGLTSIIRYKNSHFDVVRQRKRK